MKLPIVHKITTHIGVAGIKEIVLSGDEAIYEWGFVMYPIDNRDYFEFKKFLLSLISRGNYIVNVLFREIVIFNFGVIEACMVYGIDINRDVLYILFYDEKGMLRRYSINIKEYCMLVYNGYEEQDDFFRFNLIKER